jgi:hypothetical protein
MTEVYVMLLINALWCLVGYLLARSRYRDQAPVAPTRRLDEDGACESDHAH